MGATVEMDVPVTEDAPLRPSTAFAVGVVITVCAGREANLERTLDSLDRLSVQPWQTVIVFDGCPAFECAVARDPAVQIIEIDKHEPGREQPRNVGFRHLIPEVTHCWFLDSDLIFEPDLLEQFEIGHAAADVDRILIGPYEWLPPGVTHPDHALRNDPRWQSFDEHGPGHVLVHDLGASLACFSGNLVYPVEAFKRIGGFHPDLHHGRCEDGELGLRAGAAGIPMSFVRGARAWHVYHDINLDAIHARNARDVPMLNAMHPWVEGQGLLLTEKDGVRFDWRCPSCGDIVNSLEYWSHGAAHR